MRKPSRNTWYVILRTAAFAAAALPPAIRAIQLFPMWEPERVVRWRAGLGFGAILALVIIAFVFKDMVIKTVKKHMGLVKIILVAVIYVVLHWLRLAAPYIILLEEITFYALIGGLISWGLSVAALAVKRGGIRKDGNDEQGS